MSVRPSVKIFVFRSSPEGDDLIKLDSISVRPSTFFSSDLDETWYVGGGRPVVHEVIFPVMVNVKVTGVERCEIRPHAKSIRSDRVNGSELGVRYAYFL